MRVLQVARQSEAGDHSGEGREDDGENHREAVRIRPGCRQVEGFGAHPLGSRAQQEGRDGDAEDYGHHPQHSDSQVRALRQDQREEPEGGGNAHEPRVHDHVPVGPDPVEHRSERLAESHHVERDGDGLRKIEGDPDDPADAGAEGAADDVVGAPAGHPAVRRDLGYCEDRRDGDQMGDRDDREGAEEPDIRDGVAEAEEEDRPQDGADRRQEDRSGAEAVSGRGSGAGVRILRISHLMRCTSGVPFR